MRKTYFLKEQHIAAHYSPLIHRNFGQLVIPQKTAHCSPIHTSLPPPPPIPT